MKKNKAMSRTILLFVLSLAACNGKQPAGPDTLPAPTGLTAVLEGNDNARLAWEDNCPDENGYYLFVRGSAGVKQEMFTLPVNATSYLAEGLNSESEYFFSLQAFRDDGALSLRANFPVLQTPAARPVEPEPDPSEVLRLQWTEVGGLSLPEAVQVYKTEDALEGKPFHAWYAVAKCDKEVEFKVLFPGDQKTQTIDQQAEDHGKCLVLVNGGIFSGKFLRPIGFALYDGVQTPWRVSEDEDQIRIDREYWSADGKLHPVSRGLFGVDRDGVPGIYWSFTPEHGTVYVYDQPIPSTAGEKVCQAGSTTYPCPPASWVPYNAVTCGPVLLKDGKCPISAEKTAQGHWKTNYELWADDIFGVTQHPDRTAVGYKADGSIILLVCDGRIPGSDGATTLQMAKIMRSLGCIGALNLDGGGSTGMWVKGAGHLNDLTGGNRPVVTTLGFFLRQ